MRPALPAEPSSVPSARPVETAEPDVPTPVSVLQREDAVTQAVLSNGLTVIVQENHVAPVATVRCYVRNTGSAMEGDRLGAGLSHVLEHVVSGGSTAHRSEKQIEQIIDSFGGATNAYTTTHFTGYYIDCPANDVRTAIELLADAMQHVRFEPAELDRELKVVQQELADGEADRRRVLWKLVSQTIYTEHPARHPIIGYLDVLRRVDRQAIVDFYRQRYVPNNQVFVVVGDVDTQEVLSHVARQWAGTPRGPETYVALPDEPEQLSPRSAVRAMEGPTFDLVLAWPTVRLSHPDLYALDLAAYILAEGKSSRLVQRLKYEKQLVLSVSTASYTPEFVRGWFGILAVCRPETFAEAEAEILREVQRLANEPVSPSELAKAKKQKAAELVFGQQTVQQAAESLGRSFLATGDPLFEKRYVEQIEKVSAQDVQEVARRYFVSGRLNRVVITPLGETAQAASTPPAPAEGTIHAARLANGVRVLVKRHAHRPLVNLQVFVLAGSLVDTPETAGRSALVAEMLDKGTPSRSAQQIAELFDSLGAEVAISAGRNTLYGSLTVLTPDFAQAASVFAECFTQPSFPSDQFEKAKTLALAAIARRSAEPHQEAMELFYDSLPAESPFHLHPGGKKDTVEKLTIEDLRRYHRHYVVPNNMLVTVFGDIEVQQAMRIVEEHFGRLAPASDFQAPSFQRDNAVAQSVLRHKQTAKPTAVLVVGYSAPSIFNREDTAAMTVLDAMLSGYTYPGGWLHNQLRGEGLVYGVHAWVMSGPAPGFFVIVAQTRPDTLAEVARRVQEAIQRAKDGRFDDQEFQTAKRMVIALHAQQNTTIAEQAQQAALDELYGLGYDYDKSFDARIHAVRREDVVRVARHYLTHSVQVTTAPLPSP